MMRTSNPDPRGTGHLLKKLSRLSLTLLAAAVVVSAMMNLMASVGADGKLHGIGTWILAALANLFWFGFVALSLIVMVYASILAAGDRWIDGKRTLIFTWMIPFFSAVFFFAFSVRDP